MNEKPSFEVSQDLELVPLERVKAYTIPTRDWQSLKTKIKNIGDRPNLYLAFGLLLLGVSIPIFIQCIAGDFPKTPQGNISTQHVIWWAAFAVCFPTGLLLLFLGRAQKGIQTIKSGYLIEVMEEIEGRFTKVEEPAIESEEQFLFYDKFEVFTGWNDYKGGTVLQSKDFPFQGVYCLKKDKSNDPNGGYKLLKTSGGLGLLFSGWIYRPLESSGGTGNRIAIEDEHFNGYGFMVYHGTKGAKFAVIERRLLGKPTYISGNKGFKVETNDWYKFNFFMRHGGKFELVLFDSYEKELVRVESKPDSTYNSFDRVVVQGDMYITWQN